MQFGSDGLVFGHLGDSWMHLCIDMQRMFAEPTPWETPWMDRILPEVLRLVEVAPERTVFTRFLPPLHPEDMPGTWQRYWRRWPSMSAERLPEGLEDLVKPLGRFTPPALVVDKNIYSPWYGPLQQMLADRNVDTLVVSGTETDVCVLAAVIGAIDRGYRVVIAIDAVCSSADDPHDAMVSIYRSRFGMQVETAHVSEILASR